MATVHDRQPKSADEFAGEFTENVVLENRLIS